MSKQQINLLAKFNSAVKCTRYEHTDKTFKEASDSLCFKFTLLMMLATQDDEKQELVTSLVNEIKSIACYDHEEKFHRDTPYADITEHMAQMGEVLLQDAPPQMIPDNLAEALKVEALKWLDWAETPSFAGRKNVVRRAKVQVEIAEKIDVLKAPPPIMPPMKPGLTQDTPVPGLLKIPRLTQ